MIGIDVSKDKLDVYIEGGTEVRTYNNTVHIVGQLTKELQKLPGAHVAMEATGGYEQLSARIFAAAGIAVSIVNPARVRAFAKSQGTQAKNDALDARMIAAFAKSLATNGKLEESKILQEEDRKLRDLVTRRAQLTDLLTQEKNRLGQALGPAKKSVERIIKLIENEIDKVTEMALSITFKDEQMKMTYDILESTKGVGEVTALTMCALLPEIGTVNKRKISALVGLAPYDNDSGKRSQDKAGKRSIRGGRTDVRCMLFMATMSSIRHNEYIRNYYAKLRSKGKLKMVAMVACMHKLLICLNAMVRDKKKWCTPKTMVYTQPCAHETGGSSAGMQLSTG
jgi:transposase